jgi:hypothetical protein
VKLTVTKLNRWIKQLENAERAMGNVVRELEAGFETDAHLPHLLDVIQAEVIANRINIHVAKKMLNTNRLAMIEYQESQPQ